MLSLNRWQTGPALVILLGMSSSTIAPFTIAAADAAPASYKVAQLFPSQSTPVRRLTIPAGARLPVQYDAAEKIVVLPTETQALTLTIARNIRSTAGDLLVPAGSQVKGKLQPADGGSQFVADQLLLTDGTVLPLNATSEVITRTEEIRRGADTGSILKGAAIGAGAATIISGITGKRRITLGKILLGGGLGALGGLLLGKKQVEVISINPNSDLTLTLNSSLALRTTSRPY